MKIYRRSHIFSVALLLPICALASDPYCSSTELTNCLGITQEECIQATENSINLCSEQYNLDSKTLEEMRPLMREFGDCASKQFMSFASVSEKRLYECEPHFAEVNKIELEKARKRKEEFDKRFFEEDDPLHRYNK